jgi:hypothetical protein
LAYHSTIWERLRGFVYSVSLPAAAWAALACIGRAARLRRAFSRLHDRAMCARLPTLRDCAAFMFTR